PGVPGIGIKTAADLIKEFGDLDTLLSRAGEIKQPKRRERLVTYADQARTSRELVRLKEDTPLDLPIEETGVADPDAGALLGFMRTMEFNTLTRRVSEALGVEAPPPLAASVGSTVAKGTPKHTGASEPAHAAPPADDAAGTPARGASEAAHAAVANRIDRSAYETVIDPERIAAWIAEATALGHVAFDTETTSLDAMQADLVGVSMALAPGRACYVPLQHRKRDGLDLDGGGALEQAPLRQTLELLKPMLESPSVLKIGQNLKYDALVLARYGIRLTAIDDTMLMSYALDAGRGGHGMDDLAERHLGHTCIAFTKVLEHAPAAKKSERTFAEVPIDKATEYAAEDADVTLRLWMKLKPRLVAERRTTVYETLERPLIAVLVDMERAGIKVDRAILSRLSGSFAQTIARLESEVHALAGGPFNLASPRQLGELLFDTLKLPGGKRTKSGQWETRAGLLDDLAAREDLPDEARQLINTMLEWRQLSKLRSTYTDALPAHINPDTGRIHTSYAMA
ncbi:MAG: DNA polymerase I, partial [Hyphomicrobiaceae bacterium]|nr:DNA polymerase I [Hyphomicrobiaceae bacterium]